jgi:hypothetical protein
MNRSLRGAIVLTALIFITMVGHAARRRTPPPAGLMTPFADVTVRNVPLGQPYAVIDSAGGGLMVQNLGEAPVKVRVDVLAPGPRELRDGARAIPDVRWLTVEPQSFELPGRGEIVCRVTLTVPARPAYRKGYFQATLWSHTQNDTGGVAVNAGLLSRFRFKTK